jgi:hypothetical protein
MAEGIRIVKTKAYPYMQSKSIPAKNEEWQYPSNEEKEKTSHFVSVTTNVRESLYRLGHSIIFVD